MYRFTNRYLQALKVRKVRKVTGTGWFPLISASFVVEDIKIADLVLVYPSYDNLIDATHSAFADCIGSQYIFGISLFMTMIGKHLVTNNYLHWMKRRRSSFAQPLGLPADDPKLTLFIPTIRFANTFTERLKHSGK